MTVTTMECMGSGHLAEEHRYSFYISCKYSHSSHRKTCTYLNVTCKFTVTTVTILSHENLIIVTCKFAVL